MPPALQTIDAECSTAILGCVPKVALAFFSILLGQQDPTRVYQVLVREPLDGGDKAQRSDAATTW